MKQKIWYNKISEKWTQAKEWEKPCTAAKLSMTLNCSYCGSCHPPRQCLVYEKKCVQCGMTNLFREGCRSKRGKAVHHVEDQEQNLNQEEVKIDMVNVNSISFNSKCSIITANSKTSSNQARTTVLYKVDTGSEGNLMPLHIYKKLFPRATKENLAAMTNTNIQLKPYNRTITQSGTCKVKKNIIINKKCVISLQLWEIGKFY